MPLFLPSREGSVNQYLFSDSATYFDEFIASKKESDGIDYNYREIAIALLVRSLCMYPALNRFVSNSRIYQRNNIDVAMMVHKSLKGDEPETTVKVRFSGHETVKEVKEKLDKEILRAVQTKTESDKEAKKLAKTPIPILKMAMGALRAFDKAGWLSDEYLFKTSPFHSSIFFTDLKSIGLEYIYHHLFNFGNCPFFAAMGKPTQKPVVNDKGEIVVDKILEVGFSVDDRCVDGLNLAFMLKAIKRMMRNLSVLERPPHDYEIRKSQS